MSVDEIANSDIMNGANKSSTRQNDFVDEISHSEETKSSMLKGIQTTFTSENDGRLMENQCESSAPKNMRVEVQVKLEEHDSKGLDNSSPNKEKPKK